MIYSAGVAFKSSLNSVVVFVVVCDTFKVNWVGSITPPIICLILVVDDLLSKELLASNDCIYLQFHLD